MPDPKKLVVSYAPFWHNGSRIPDRSLQIVLAALPAALFGVYRFGIPALGVLALAVSSAVLWELAFTRVAKRPVSVGDGTAAVIGLLFGVALHYGVSFWLGVVLNSFVFASLAVCMAMLVKSHADQALLTNFFITPMAFLGGTFFPVDRMPSWAQKLLHFLPLTHAARSIRGSAFGATPDFFSYGLLAGLGSVLFVLAFYCVNKAKE